MSGKWGCSTLRYILKKSQGVFATMYKEIINL